MVRQELNVTIAHGEEGTQSVNGVRNGNVGGGVRATGGTTTATTGKAPSGRTPNCARCKNHNKTVLLRGHKRYCPYVECVCDKCKLIARRQVVMAKQVALRRAQALDEAMGRTVIEEIDPEELKQAAENGSMPPADCVTAADVALPSLPSSPYSPSPPSSSSSSSSFAAPPHPLYGPASPSPLFAAAAAAADGSPPLFMSLPFPMPPSPRRPCDAWSRSEVSPYLSGVPGVPPPLHLAALPRPIPTGGIHHGPTGPRYDAGAVGPLGGDVSVTAAAAAAATTYASSVYAYDRSIAAVAGVTPHFEHHPGIPLSSYGPSLLWWD